MGKRSIGRRGNSWLQGFMKMVRCTSLELFPGSSVQNTRRYMDRPPSVRSGGKKKQKKNIKNLYYFFSIYKHNTKITDKKETGNPLTTSTE